MPRLSCIIPVVGDAHGLETTLVSVLEHLPDDCEIIVVHSARYDDPYDLKNELRFIEAPRRTDYVGCANLGIEAAHAPVVHLLAAGLEATAGGAEAALARFSEPRVAAVSPVVCNQLRTDEVLAAGLTYNRGGRVEVRRDLPASVPLADTIPIRQAAEATSRFPIARAAFYRRSALDLFGGGLPAMVGNELAAVELGLSLTQAAQRSVLEPGCKVLGSPKSCGVSHGFGFGLAAERLFWRNLPASGFGASIAMHPFSVMRELAGSMANGAALLQLTGRLWAYATLGDCRARARTIARLRNSRPSAPKRHVGPAARLIFASTRAIASADRAVRAIFEPAVSPATQPAILSAPPAHCLRSPRGSGTETTGRGSYGSTRFDRPVPTYP